jgi:hypothetical protein
MKSEKAKELNRMSLMEILLWITENCYPHPANEQGYFYVNHIYVMLQAKLHFWQKKKFEQQQQAILNRKRQEFLINNQEIFRKKDNFEDIGKDNE